VLFETDIIVLAASAICALVSVCVCLRTTWQTTDEKWT